MRELALQLISVIQSLDNLEAEMKESRATMKELKERKDDLIRKLLLDIYEREGV